MYKVTEMVGKKLIDIDTARDLGEIQGVAYKKGSSCAIMTADGQYVAEKIFSVKDAVSVLQPAPATDYLPLDIGKTAYDTTGKHLGTLAEIQIGNTLKLAYAHLDDATAIGRGKIYAVGDVLLIRAKTPPHKTVTSKRVKSTGDKTPTTTGKIAVHWLQNRRYGDFSFLIGKTVDKTITNFQGELMIKQGERVTNTILRQAKVSGKLIELCLHTK